jgi:hypothetical protein
LDCDPDQSGPQSKTLTRHPLNPSQLAGYSIFEASLAFRLLPGGQNRLLVPPMETEGAEDRVYPSFKRYLAEENRPWGGSARR